MGQLVPLGGDSYLDALQCIDPIIVPDNTDSANTGGIILSDDHGLSVLAKNLPFRQVVILEVTIDYHLGISVFLHTGDIVETDLAADFSDDKL